MRPLANSCHITWRRGYSTSSTLKAISSIRILNSSGLHNVDIEQFRTEAFKPELPLLIKDPNRRTINSIPALNWFSPWKQDPKTSGQPKSSSAYNELKSRGFDTAILPYEFIAPSRSNQRAWEQIEALKVQLDSQDHNADTTATRQSQYLSRHLPSFTPTTPETESFHTFDAPGSLFLQAIPPETSIPLLASLYIAQCQLSSLPPKMKTDLPTPRLVKTAGKGDVYNENLWLGTPPTYTPLHKDPNPNLFLQLSSRKVVRIFRPVVGRRIFHDVQTRIGGGGNASFRGSEMMEGEERRILEEVVWDDETDNDGTQSGLSSPGSNKTGTTREGSSYDGFETSLGPGDALFIPKGWWHSIKSVGEELNASVNWWFR